MTRPAWATFFESTIDMSSATPIRYAITARALSGCATSSTIATDRKETTLGGMLESGIRKPMIVLAIPVSATRVMSDVLRRDRSSHVSWVYAPNRRSPISSSYTARRRVAHHCIRTVDPPLSMMSPHARAMSQGVEDTGIVPMTGSLTGVPVRAGDITSAMIPIETMSRSARRLENTTKRT